ncbi:MAG: ROK family protein [Terriglobales bacterium]
MVLGVDIGGTKVAAGLVDRHGRILNRSRFPMNAHGTAADGLSAVAAAIEAVRGRRHPTAIGLSSPGPLDPQRGLVLNPPNLPCWRNFPLARAVARRFHLPVYLDNDANAAALAEARWGAGRGFRSVFYATLGTGIGAGLVLDGHIYHGRTGAAVEAGHVSLDPRGPLCGCGKRGCIEAFASGPALARRARRRVQRDPVRGRTLLRLAAGRPLASEHVAAAWRAADPLASQLLASTADWLAMWLGTIVDLLEPEVILFGGGMGKLLAAWFPHIRRRLPEFTINSRALEIPLRAARYGAQAGIAGAAALCTP